MLQRLFWGVGPCSGREETPAEFVPAAVPGAVQLDWAKAKGLPGLMAGIRKTAKAGNIGIIPCLCCLPFCRTACV